MAIFLRSIKRFDLIIFLFLLFYLVSVNDGIRDVTLIKIQLLVWVKLLNHESIADGLSQSKSRTETQVALIIWSSQPPRGTFGAC